MNYSGQTIPLNLIAGEAQEIAPVVHERMTLVVGAVEIEYKDAENSQWRIWPAGSRINGLRRNVQVRAKVDGAYIIELETDIELSGTVQNEIVLAGGTIDLLRQIEDVSATVQGKLKEKSLDGATVTALQAAFAAALVDPSVQAAFQSTFTAAIGAAQPIQTTA